MIKLENDLVNRLREEYLVDLSIESVTTNGIIGKTIIGINDIFNILDNDIKINIEILEGIFSGNSITFYRDLVLSTESFPITYYSDVLDSIKEVIDIVKELVIKEYYSTIEEPLFRKRVYQDGDGIYYQPGLVEFNDGITSSNSNSSDITWISSSIGISKNDLINSCGNIGTNLNTTTNN